MDAKYSGLRKDKQEYKPPALANADFPFDQLPSGRRFEELVYSLFESEINHGALKTKFDKIQLMQGVGERGRDSLLYYKDKPYGLIQCKHSQKGTPLTKPNCAKEIFKFLLHYLLDNSLIYDQENFSYYFVSSSNFSEPAFTLLNNFKEELFKEQDWKKWVDSVISSPKNKALNKLRFHEIEEELTSVISSLKISIRGSRDLTNLLSKPINQNLESSFFTLRHAYGEHRGESDIERQSSLVSIKELLKQFRQASFHLSKTQDFFTNQPHSHIDRKETQEILQWVKMPIPPKQKPISLLVGDAGMGKTVIFKDLLCAFQKTCTPVIGIKADKYYVDDVQELEKKLGLDLSLEASIKRLLEEHEQVIVLIDQIDALSQTLSAKREYLYAFNQLVNNISDIEGVRIIISVRTFDLAYDTELKFYDDQKSFTLKKLTYKEIKPILNHLGLRIAELKTELIELLSIPHHLNLFCKIYSSQIKLDSIKTENDLYNELWKLKVIKVTSTSIESRRVSECLFHVANQMEKCQQISIPELSIIEIWHDELQYLISTGLLESRGKEIQFFHQTFYDFCQAKWFVQSGADLLDYLNENHQGLFVRARIKRILVFLRDFDPSRYIKILDSIITIKANRFHIQHLALTVLGLQENIYDLEKKFVKRIIFKDRHWLKYFYDCISSVAWFRFLVEEGVLRDLLNEVGHGQLSDEEIDKVDLVFGLLRRILPKGSEEAVEFMSSMPNFHGKEKFIFRILYFTQAWDHPSAQKLFIANKHVRDTDEHGYFHILENVAKVNFEWALEQYTEAFDNSLSTIEKPTKAPDFGYNHNCFLKLLFELDLRRAFELCFYMVKSMSSRSLYPDDRKLKNDYAFGLFRFERKYSHDKHESVYQLTLEMVEELATKYPESFSDFIKENYKTQSITVLRLLVYGIKANPKRFSSDGVILFLRYRELIQGGSGVLEYEVRQLIGSIYEWLSMEEKQSLNTALFSIKDKWATSIEVLKNGEKRHHLGSYGRSQLLYLNAIPESQIKSQPDLKMKKQELKRKLGDIRDNPPMKTIFGSISAPLPQRAYQNMSWDQWEKSFLRFNEEHTRDYNTFKGGIDEHARAFQNEVSNRPDQFIPFIEKIIMEKKVPSVYIVKGLEGLKEAKIKHERFADLWLKGSEVNYEVPYILYFIFITDYLIEQKGITMEIVRFLAEMAIGHNDPPTEESSASLQDSINTVRGAAATRLVSCGYDSEFKEVIFRALNQVAEDSNLSVRLSIMPRLAFLMNLDEKQTFEIFLKVTNKAHESILEHTIWSAQNLTKLYFNEMKDYFFLALKVEEIQPNLAIILAVCWLDGNNDAYPILRKALELSDKAKSKMIDVAISNMLDEPDEIVWAKCVDLFEMYLDNDQESIVQEYSTAYLHLKPENFGKMLPLLRKYSQSKVAKASPHYYFEYLIQCSKLNPKECLDLISNFHEFNKPHISQSGYYEDEPIKVVIGAYNSLRNILDEDTLAYQEKAISIFDLMLQDDRFRGSAFRLIDSVDR